MKEFIKKKEALNAFADDNQNQIVPDLNMKKLRQWWKYENQKF